MTAAVENAPVRRKPGPKPKEIVSVDAGKQIQPEDISLQLGTPLERGEEIEIIDKPLESEYARALLMAEEPITIRIEPSQQENAPTVVDVWCNGKGAEVMDPKTGKWIEINCLPIGGVITTKRKYVEILARAKFDTIATKTGDTRQENPENRLVRNTGSKAVFSVLQDDNPKGREWLVRLMSER